MLYRSHRGSLKQSMKTVVGVASKEELILHLNKSVYKMYITDIKFDYSSYDNRTGWDTYHVSAQYENIGDFSIVGMSNSDKFD